MVAIGTSLPELAASGVSALRGHHDIAIGNVFGSNLFNIMLVMTSAGAISPIALSPEVFSRDYLSLCVMTLLLVAMVAWTLHRGARLARAALSRRFGFILVSGYGLYYVLLWPSIAGS